MNEGKKWKLRDEVKDFIDRAQIEFEDKFFGAIILNRCTDDGKGIVTDDGQVTDGGRVTDTNAVLVNHVTLLRNVFKVNHFRQLM